MLTAKSAVRMVCAAAVLSSALAQQAASDLPAPDQNQNATEHVELGLDALKRGDRKTAIEHYQTARSINEDSAKALGDAIPKRVPKNLDECIWELDWILSEKNKNIIRQPPDHVDFHFGICLWMRNEWGLWRGDRLAKYFNEMGVYHPDDMSGIILEAYQAHLQGKLFNFQKQPAPTQKDRNLDKARKIKIYKKSVRINSNDTSAHMELGQEYASARNWEKAIKEFQRCIAIDSEETYCYIDLALVYFATGRSEDGIAVLQRGIKANPEDADDLRFSLAYHYSGTGDWENAINEMKKIENKNSKNNLVLGNALYQTEQWNEAVKSLKEWLNDFPNDANATYLMGVSYAHIPDMKSAMETCTLLSMLDEEKAAELKSLIESLGKN